MALSHGLRALTRKQITNLTAEEPTIVEGAGVVGKVPVIEPGAVRCRREGGERLCVADSLPQTHEYFSSCPCRSLTVMRGRFRLQDLDSGDFFGQPCCTWADMAPFSHDSLQWPTLIRLQCGRCQSRWRWLLARTPATRIDAVSYRNEEEGRR